MQQEMPQEKATRNVEQLILATMESNGNMIQET